MATKKKLLEAAAGSAGGGEGLNVEEVFSTYLYEGNSSTQTINNGIDLTGEGGLTWFKCRNVGMLHNLFDTERGETQRLATSTTSAQSAQATGRYPTFTSTGFTLGNDTGGDINYTGRDYASWTFCKAPKFFTMVTWSGNSTMGRTISHDLGADVGFILIKAVDKADAWYALHKDSNMLVLNQTTAEYSEATTADYFGDGTNIVRPTSTEFTIGSDAGINGTGYNYIAYLFAHNDGDGEFGPDGDADIIKCGSFTGAGYSESEQFNVNLGFEPQWIMYKRTDSSTGGGWFMVDNMRGWRPETSSNFEYLQAQSLDAEAQSGALGIRSDGFRVREGLGRQYIYIAIRRGPMAVPESATDVFAMDTLGGTSPTPPGFNSGFPVDMAFLKPKSSSSDWLLASRLIQGKQLVTNSTAAEVNETANVFDYMNGYYDFPYSDSNYQAWMWKRAPSFCDVVAYTGNGTAGRTVSHNLGVAPEMIWVKKRNASGSIWAVYHKDVGATKFLRLNTSDGEVTLTALWNDTAPTSDVFTVGTGGSVNDSGDTFIAYLFASLDGVSKVGSYTGTGSNVDVDCGFSSGARFIIIKRSDSTSDWYVYDTERGIVSGADPFLLLNKTDAQDAGNDGIDPQSNGFRVTSNSGLNTSGGTYIFYAIA